MLRRGCMRPVAPTTEDARTGPAMDRASDLAVDVLPYWAELEMALWASRNRGAGG